MLGPGQNWQVLCNVESCRTAELKWSRNTYSTRNRRTFATCTIKQLLKCFAYIYWSAYCCRKSHVEMQTFVAYLANKIKLLVWEWSCSRVEMSEMSGQKTTINVQTVNGPCSTGHLAGSPPLPNEARNSHGHFKYKHFAIFPSPMTLCLWTMSCNGAMFVLEEG